MLPNDSDSESILSDDSVLPDGERSELYSDPPTTLYQACARNDPDAVSRMLERGVTREEATELDVNGRNGFMLAVSRGFVDVVTRLHACPHLDINHQDKDGNTALMIAAQAGFVTILNYTLNYYSGVDTEVRDPRGFTALIKAGLQGREDCVAALLMHGADMNAMDLVQRRGLKEWVVRTGRFETLNRIRRLQARPVAEQFCPTYVPEWPELTHLTAKATMPRTTSQKLRQRLKDSLTFRFPHDPETNGVMDHMVRMTTGFHSPLIATGCRPLCPSSPPALGRRRLAVPELVEKHSRKELEHSVVSHTADTSFTSASPTSMSSASLTSCCQEPERQESAALPRFMPRSMTRRNSIFPSGCIPKIEVTKSGEPTPKKEKKKKGDTGYLEPPVWKYKEAKEKKKKEKEKELDKETNGSKRPQSQK
ncbi:photoreceptor ankyrin repeat protein [Synchiropus picturatus]